MIVVTTENVVGHRIVRSLGLVRGNSIRSRHLGHVLVAFFRRLVGGEIRDYTKMMAEAREQAYDRMVAEAEALGANAILAVRFASSEVMAGAAEIIIYGTAAVIE
jgi:uncharacterized protein YbjQ (UPF0145 family)